MYHIKNSVAFNSPTMFPVEKALPVKYDPRVLLQMCVDWLRGDLKMLTDSGARFSVWEGLRESSPQLQPASKPASIERVQDTENIHSYSRGKALK